MQADSALQAAMAPHDANRDGAFSYDEYMDAQASVSSAGAAAEAGGSGSSVAAAPLPSACSFGPVIREG